MSTDLHAPPPGGALPMSLPLETTPAPPAFPPAADAPHRRGPLVSPPTSPASSEAATLPTGALVRRYLNKELSWLEFNARVLDEALNPQTPLLERLKFLAIFATNLDEFYMVRVAGLKKMSQEALRTTDSPDEMETSAVLDRIRARTLALVERQYRCLHDEVLPALSALDVKVLRVDELTPTQRQAVDATFETDISPVLTPLGVDPAHPFPFLSNQALYLVVIPKELKPVAEGENPGLGFVEVPTVIPRLIPVKTEQPGAHHFVLLEDLIAANLGTLFFGMPVAATYMIRVTRNLDYNLLENKVVDLLKTIQREMVNREHQEVVRIEVDRRVPGSVLDVLKTQLQVTDADVYPVGWPTHIPSLMPLYHLVAREDLKEPPFNPRLPQALAGNEDIFSVIAGKDLLVHHPYESFYAVTEFLHSAAHDPHVLAIKQTLYRSAGDSPIIDSLIAAAENGKQVTAVIELKARFDEKNNISWARRLERAGVNVVFGFVGLKTHGKAVLVVRREKNKLTRYVHLSTGNYNSATARLYTDVGFFTADDDIGLDVATLFNLITGFDVFTGAHRMPDQQIAAKLKKLALAPVNLRQTIVGLIDREIEAQKKQGNGFIFAKMNALVDKDIIDALYRASAAGVRIRLIVRGICSLRPGVPGLSETIEVISVVDRFLEHSRIYYFHANGEHKVFLSSADWMTRNMDRRIEAFWPIEKAEIKARLMEEILNTYWADNVKARVLTADGDYLRRAPAPGAAPLRAQQRLIDIAREGGVQSMPYDIAIRHNTGRKPGQRPIARKKQRKAQGDAAVAGPFRMEGDASVLTPGPLANVDASSAEATPTAPAPRVGAEAAAPRADDVATRAGPAGEGGGDKTGG
jgi:polyphosphate kinase